MNKKGFTLVELIVTILIVGILAAIIVPGGLGYLDKKREDQCAINRKAILSYYNSACIEIPELTLGEYLDFMKDPSLVDSKTINGESLDPKVVTILKNNLQAAGLSNIKCPSGGKYESVGNNLICSIHQGVEVNDADLITPAPQPNSTPVS